MSLPRMSLEILVVSRIEDEVVTFEYENGYTIDCELCNVKNFEKYNVNDIVDAIINNDENGNITIQLLQKNQEEMTRRAEKVAAAERILSETIGKTK